MAWIKLPTTTTPTTTTQNKTTTATTTTPTAKTPSLAPITNVPVNDQGQTQYNALGGSDLNNILYLKKLYEGSNGNTGQQKWASGQAGQYYGNLSPELAAQVKGMTAQQLNDYIAGGNAKNLASSSPVSTGTTNTTNTMNTTSNDLINQQRDLAAKNLQDQAYDARNQADAMNLQTAKGLQEIMANQGLGSSGENITAMLNQNAQRQGAITSINNQLSQNLNELDINRAKQLQDQYNIDSDRALQIAQLMGDYNGQRTLAGQQYDRGVLESDRDYNRGVLESDRTFDFNKQMQLADLLGTYNGQQTLAGQQFDFNKQMSLADLLGTYNGQNTMARDQFDWQKSTDARDYNRGVTESDRSYELQRAAAARAAASGGGGNRISSNTKYPAANTIIDNLNRNFTYKNPTTGRYEVSDMNALEDYILSLDYPDSLKNEVLGYYQGLGSNGSQSASSPSTKTSFSGLGSSAKYPGKGQTWIDVLMGR